MTRLNLNEDEEVCRGLMTCIKRCFPYQENQSHVIAKPQDYSAPTKLFGYTNAIRERTKKCCQVPLKALINSLNFLYFVCFIFYHLQCSLLNPCHLLGLWWQNFGNDMPNLKRNAIQIVNQTYSALSCEQN